MAKNSSIDKMILRIAVSINTILYNYINFSVFSERANFSPVRVRRENVYQLPMALLDDLPKFQRSNRSEIWCGRPGGGSQGTPARGKPPQAKKYGFRICL